MIQNETETNTDEMKQWSSERTAVYSLIYFNSLLLVYNLLFLIYAIMGYHMDERSYLITFLPVLVFFQILMMTNFTLRYYQLARVMHIFFNHNITKTLEASTPEAMRRNKRIVRVIEIMIYLLALSSASCGIFGDICISDAYGTGKRSRDPDEIEYCKRFVLA